LGTMVTLEETQRRGRKCALPTAVCTGHRKGGRLWA
jgi:hypothetical protein